MRRIPEPLRQIFRPMAPRSSALEQGLALTSILAAVVLAAMALVVHRINSDADEAAKRSIRSIEVAATLDRLQVALRDGEMASRDLAGGRSRDRADAERFEAARFQARLNLTALSPLTGDEPAQSERLSRLGPLIYRKLEIGPRGTDVSTPDARDQIDGLIASMRTDETHRLETYRATQLDANEKSTWIMIGALSLLSGLSLVFWILLKIEFRARRALERRLIASATTDEMTGVANRSDFDRKLIQEWTFRNRYGTALSLLLIDVDHLKAHNERWGHLAGDAILREVARRLGLRIRSTEVLARSGGDEFAVIVPQYQQEAMALAEQLREQVSDATFNVQNGGQPVSIRVTVSIGVAEASDVASPRELLVAADDATCRAKAAGRNAVEAYRPRPPTGGGAAATTAGGVRNEPFRSGTNG